MVSTTIFLLQKYCVIIITVQVYRRKLLYLKLILGFTFKQLEILIGQPIISFIRISKFEQELRKKISKTLYNDNCYFLELFTILFGKQLNVWLKCCQLRRDFQILFNNSQMGHLNIIISENMNYSYYFRYSLRDNEMLWTFYVYKQKDPATFQYTLQLLYHQKIIPVAENF